MIEYEIKFIGNRINHSKFVDGLSYVGTKHQNDTYYDTPNFTLFLNAVFLRCRNKKIIDIKYNFDQSDKTHLFCNENSFTLPLSEEAKNGLDIFLSQLIQPIQSSDDLLKNYQLEEFVAINKSRDIYQGKDIEVSFDTIDNLGEFIEIEARTEKGIDDINNLIHKEKIQRIQIGYVELYLKQHNYELYQKGKYQTE